MNKITSVAGLYIQSVIKRLLASNMIAIGIIVIFRIVESVLNIEISKVIDNVGKTTFVIIPILVITLIVLTSPFDSARDNGQGILRRLRIDIYDIAVIEGCISTIIFFITWKLWMILFGIQEAILLGLYEGKVAPVAFSLKLVQLPLLSFFYPRDGFGIVQYLLCILAGIITGFVGFKKLSGEKIKKIGT